MFVYIAFSWVKGPGGRDQPEISFLGPLDVGEKLCMEKKRKIQQSGKAAYRAAIATKKYVLTMARYTGRKPCLYLH